MPKRKYLDEISYLDENGQIHIDVPKRNQGTIQKARSWQRRLTDEIAGSAKAQLKGDIPVSPYLAYPAAGVVASTILNPISTVITGLKGAIGANTVNYINKKIRGKSWAKDISDDFDINEDVAEFTNPGFLLGGYNTNIKKANPTTLKSLVYNSNKNNRQTINKAIKTLKTVLPRGITDAAAKALPFIEQQTNKNYGSIITLPSSNKIINLGDADFNYRRTLLKRINKIFTSRYGYKSLPLSAAENREATERVIKDLMTQHNTFIRGVGDKKEYINSTNKKLEALGLEPTKENRLIYYATHYAPYTGAGRANFDSSYYPEGYGTIYTSNMLGVGKGYGRKRSYRGIDDGGTFIVRRPLDFTSPNLEDWVINNEFMFNGRGNTVGGRNYFYYDLPYYLKTGRTLEKEYIENNPLPVLDKDEANVIRDKITEDYFKHRGTSVEDTKFRHKSINNTLNQFKFNFTLPNKIVGNRHEAVAAANIEHDTERYAVNLRDNLTKRAVKKILKDNPDLTFGNASGFKLKDNNDFFALDFFEQQRILEANDKLNKYVDDNLNSALKGYYYGRWKHFDKEVEKSKQDLNAKIKGAFINRQYKNKYKRKVDLKFYAKDKGITPTQQRNIVIGDRTGRNVTINSTKNPGQHFIFVGPIDEQGLDVVRRFTWNELKNINSTDGGHYAPWTEGFSRKVRKLGGTIPRRSLATGGSIYIKPSHRGRLTELKARTGKSEAELYNDGNPAHKKW